ncbi:hypothetical protein BS78_05G064300 [Paspalum vaginatum]|nr:hypothetical protein BS78_05G064300 [Paspalum vaginatum]
MAGDGPKIKPEEEKEEEPKEGEKEKRLVFDRSLGTAAGLSKLLPTGTTLAFQTMAPSFTNSGECEDHDVNFAFTWGLVGFLTLLCALLCSTDSVRDDDGNIHYGVATPSGFKLFGHHFRDLKMANQDKRSLRRRKRLKPQDFVHALMSAAVFVALAFSDAGVQQCLVPMDSAPWKGFLTHLPLAVAFLASIVFIVFPSTRTGVGDDSAWSGWDTSSKDAEAAKEKPQQQ